MSKSKKWSHKQTEYMYWLATPASERKPRYKKEIANDLGITDRTLRNWENLNEFWLAVDEITARHINRRLADVINGIAQSAVDGNSNSQRLFVEIAGLIQTQGVKIDMQQNPSTTINQPFSADVIRLAAEVTDDFDQALDFFSNSSESEDTEEDES